MSWNWDVFWVVLTVMGALEYMVTQKAGPEKYRDRWGTQLVAFVVFDLLIIWRISVLVG